MKILTEIAIIVEGQPIQPKLWQFKYQSKLINLKTTVTDMPCISIIIKKNFSNFPQKLKIAQTQKKWLCSWFSIEENKNIINDVCDLF